MGDDNKLIAGNSNSDGALYLLENTFSEVRIQFNPVDISDSQSITMDRLIRTRRYFGDEPLTMNSWHDIYLHYFENGTASTTFAWSTNRSPAGDSVSIEHTGQNNLAGSSFPMSGTLLADRFTRGKNSQPQQITTPTYDGEEIFYEMSNNTTADWGIFGFENGFEDSNR